MSRLTHATSLGIFRNPRLPAPARKFLETSAERQVESAGPAWVSCGRADRMLAFAVSIAARRETILGCAKCAVDLLRSYRRYQPPDLARPADRLSRLRRALVREAESENTIHHEQSVWGTVGLLLTGAAALAELLTAQSWEGVVESSAERRRAYASIMQVVLVQEATGLWFDPDSGGPVVDVESVRRSHADAVRSVFPTIADLGEAIDLAASSERMEETPASHARSVAHVTEGTQDARPTWFAAIDPGGMALRALREWSAGFVSVDDAWQRGLAAVRLVELGAAQATRVGKREEFLALLLDWLESVLGSAMHCDIGRSLDMAVAAALNAAGGSQAPGEPGLLKQVRQDALVALCISASLEAREALRQVQASGEEGGADHFVSAATSIGQSVIEAIQAGGGSERELEEAVDTLRRLWEARRIA